jgi:hypothetical protein
MGVIFDETSPLVVENLGPVEIFGFGETCI